MSKEISVVVPIYNMEAYLRQCLDSLYEQVNDIMEVILVNDGSTDKSPIIIAQYAAAHPKTIVINKTNGGLSDARNAGIEVATGRFIFFLDSDDWLASQAISTLYDFAVKNECDVVQGGFYYAFDDHLEYDDRWGIDEKTAPFFLDNEEAMAELVKQHYVKNFAWGKLYLRDIVKKIVFPVGKCFEDSYWQHQILAHVNNYGVIPRPLYYYRQRPQGISGYFSLRQLDLLKGEEERLLFFQRYYPDLVLPMAASLWRQSLDFLETSRAMSNLEESGLFEQFWLRINRDYCHLVDQALNHSLIYNVETRLPAMVRPCRFAYRVKDFLFAKRLKRLSY